MLMETVGLCIMFATSNSIVLDGNCKDSEDFNSNLCGLEGFVMLIILLPLVLITAILSTQIWKSLRNNRPNHGYPLLVNRYNQEQPPVQVVQYYQPVYGYPQN